MNDRGGPGYLGDPPDVFLAQGLEVGLGGLAIFELAIALDAELVERWPVGAWREFFGLLKEGDFVKRELECSVDALQVFLVVLDDPLADREVELCWRH